MDQNVFKQPKNPLHSGGGGEGGGVAAGDLCGRIDRRLYCIDRAALSASHLDISPLPLSLPPPPGVPFLKEGWGERYI